MAGRIRRSGEWHIREPTNIGAGIREKTNPKNESASDIKVVAEGIQTRKRDIASSAHQWNDVHPKSLEHHGHGEQENHRAAVHCEDLVINIGTHQRVLWPDQLEPDRRG
jgi:hypothetical protein